MATMAGALSIASSLAALALVAKDIAAEPGRSLARQMKASAPLATTNLHHARAEGATQYCDGRMVFYCWHRDGR